MFKFTKQKIWIIMPSLSIIIVVAVTLITLGVRTTTGKISGHPKLIIDHDGGADDALAIFMALLYEQYFNGPTVIALTTTHGNVHEDQSFMNSQKILDIAERRNVPIYRGSNVSLVISVPSDDFFGADGLGNNDYELSESIEAQSQHAALGIIELANKYPVTFDAVELLMMTRTELFNNAKYTSGDLLLSLCLLSKLECQDKFLSILNPLYGIIKCTTCNLSPVPVFEVGEVTLLTLGALTNIALAMRMDPLLINRFSHVYVAAGNVYSQNEPDAEYNAQQDVESYHIVLQKANPEKVTILPFSQVATPTVTRKWRENVLGAIPTKIMKAQNDFERISIEYKDTWILLDPIAMAAVLNKTVIGDVKYSQNSIILCGDQRGINTNKFTTAEEANVEVINGIIDEEYKNLLILIFSAELN